jgi:hypothetical protein
VTRRERLMATGVYVLLLAVWFPGLLIGEQMGQSYSLWAHFPWLGAQPAGFDVPTRDGAVDAALVFHPLLEAARDQLGDGQLPLWNPGIFGGAPLLGDWQSGWLFPLHWPALALGVAPMWGWLMAVKLLAAGLGTFVLARRLGIGQAGALVAGAAYLLSAPLVVWLQWPLATVFALLPWLLLAVDRLAREPDRRALAATATVLALSLLGGHPETCLLSVSAATVYLAVLLLARRAPLARPLGAWLLANLLGAAAAAAVALAFLQAWSDSITRADHGVLAGGHLPLWSAIVYALPNVFGDGKPAYAGPPLSYLIVAAYTGTVVLLLAAAAAARHARRPEAVALIAMAAAAFCTAFGVPPVSWLMEHVPPWSSSNNARVLYVVALGLALGAGAGVHSLAARPLPVRRVLAGAGALGIGVAVWAALLLAAEKLGAPRDVEVRAIVRFALALAAGALLLVALGRKPARWTTLLALLLVALDLAYLRGWNVVLPPREAYPGATPAVAALRDDGRVAGLWASPFGPFALPPDTGMLHGLDTVQGYDFPVSRRWADFSLHVLGQRGLTRELIFNVSPRVDRAGLAGLRLMGVTRYLTAPDAAAPAPGMAREHRGPDGAVWRDDEALPRAFLAGPERRLGERETLAALAAGTLDPRREVAVEPGAPALPAGSVPPAAAVPAAYERPAPDRIRVALPAGHRGGWVVVSETWWPFWRARVDGRDAELVPADHVAMGVAVAPGARELVLELDRRGIYAGFAVSLLAWLTIAWLARPRRRASARRP